MSALSNYATQNQYDLLSKFESLKEFNNHFEQAMVLHKNKFTKSEYIALNKLRKFAANIFGVAWCKIQKAVAGTHQDEILGVSRSTFERMLLKAKKINLITVKNQYKENKYQKHNVYVFNRVEELAVEEVGIVSKSNTIDVPENEKIDGALSINLLELKRKKKYTYQQADSANKHTNNLIDLNKPIDEYTDYDKLKNLLMQFTGDKKIAYKFYGIWLAQTSKMINKPDFDLAMKAARATLRAMKTKNIKNPRGYFNNALSGMIDKWLEDDLLRYEKDYEQAMSEDRSAFEYNNTPSNDNLFVPASIVSQERLDRAMAYLEAKKNQSINDGSDKYFRRQLRLIKYDDLLSEYVFSHASSLINEPCILPKNPFYNWLDEREN